MQALIAREICTRNKTTFRWIVTRARWAERDHTQGVTRVDDTSDNEAVVIYFRDSAEFDAWLDQHVDLKSGVWLKLAKQGTGIPSLTSEEAVDVGLCYGWMSGQRKANDEVYYLQKYVPRRTRSRWSQINVAKAEELITARRMRPSGLAEVEAAKADGRWGAAYESQRNATVPSDLPRTLFLADSA